MPVPQALVPILLTQKQHLAVIAWTKHLPLEVLVEEILAEAIRSPAYLPLCALERYLDDHGWSPHGVDQRGLQVFLGPLDSAGHPIALLVPANDVAPEKAQYVRRALTVLATMHGETLATMAEKILAYFDATPTVGL